MEMGNDELGLTSDPEVLVQRVAEHEDELRHLSQAHHSGPIESVRETTHRGHRIVVRTTYSITVDGTPIEGHLGVTNDGHVHYHAIPNLSFASALEMVEKVIDTFPEDFADAGAGDATAPDDSHGHGRGHAEHDG